MNDVDYIKPLLLRMHGMGCHFVKNEVMLPSVQCDKPECSSLMNETQIYKFCLLLLQKAMKCFVSIFTENVSFVHNPIPEVPGLYLGSSFLLFVFVTPSKF
jgi:hypothetical protein